MTSISQMGAACPNCGRDVLRLVAEHELTIGDCEDTCEFDCPECNAALAVELVAAFQVTVE